MVQVENKQNGLCGSDRVTLSHLTSHLQLCAPVVDNLPVLSVRLQLQRHKTWVTYTFSRFYNCIWQCHNHFSTNSDLWPCPLNMTYIGSRYAKNQSQNQWNVACFVICVSIEHTGEPCKTDELSSMLFGGADTRGNKFNIISFESYCLDTYKLQWSVSTTNVNDEFTAANSGLAVFCHSGYNETCKHWPVECQDYWHASVRIICPQPSVIDSNTHAYDWLERLKICQQTVQKIKQHLIELCYTNI